MTYSQKMTSTERRAIISLSMILALRMLGLFMVLPVFTLFAQQLKGATPALIGLSLGIYGLFQALFQIPFGALSDKIGRKPVIIFGLMIFAAGSLLASFAHSIEMMILARSLQGAGAIGSTVLALMADLTREDQRTKAMAISGISIGFSFSLAMLLGPLLTKWFSVSFLFEIAVMFAVLAIVILNLFTPTPAKTIWHRDTEPELDSILRLLLMPELMKLNSGIFILHAIFTASFICIPINLARYLHLATDQQWVLFVPSLLIAFVLSLIAISIAEKFQQLKPVFLLGIILLTVALLILLFPRNSASSAIGICLFFTGFSTLEAFLPSFISRSAPVTRKGSALGLYSCSQFLGIFVGGAFGGWLFGLYGYLGIYLFCLILSLLWLAIAFSMKPLRYLVIRMIKVSSFEAVSMKIREQSLRAIPGMVEVTFIPEDSVIYLKMEQSSLSHPDFIRLNEQLQSE